MNQFASRAIFFQISAKTNRTRQQLMMGSPPVSTFVTNHLSPHPNPPPKTVFFFSIQINETYTMGTLSRTVEVLSGHSVFVWHSSWEETFLRLLGYKAGRFKLVHRYATVTVSLLATSSALTRDRGAFYHTVMIELSYYLR